MSKHENFRGTKERIAEILAPDGVQMTVTELHAALADAGVGRTRKMVAWAARRMTEAGLLVEQAVPGSQELCYARRTTMPRASLALGVLPTRRPRCSLDWFVMTCGIDEVSA